MTIIILYSRLLKYTITDKLNESGLNSYCVLTYNDSWNILLIIKLIMYGQKIVFI
jgi:hypothetical protein